MGALCHIVGRGHIAIPSHPVPSCLISTSSPSAMPLSSSPVASGVLLGQGNPKGSLPVPPMIVLPSASAPLIYPPFRSAAWSTVMNYSRPLSAATRCHVITQDAGQLSGAVNVRSRRAGPACFIDRQVNPRHGIPYTTNWKRDGMHDSRSAFLTSPKASAMSGEIHCTNVHSYWSDFCSPV